MRTNRPERLRRFGYVGYYRYFLTFCTFRRRRLFVDSGNVALARSEILRAAEHTRFAVTAYCFMPDHLHLLVQSQSEAADGRQFIAHAKQYSGFVFARAIGERLWQRYCHERVLRGEDDTLSVARYILENPVRAGLAQSPGEYPFSGCPAHSMSAVLEALPWMGRSG